MRHVNIIIKRHDFSVYLLLFINLIKRFEKNMKIIEHYIISASVIILISNKRIAKIVRIETLLYVSEIGPLVRKENI